MNDDSPLNFSPSDNTDSSTTGPWVIIAPIGMFASDLLEAVADIVNRVFCFDTKTAALMAPDGIGFAYNDDRKQYHSTAIIERLTQLAPTECLKVLALTREDLFIPILTHVYGEAQLGGTSCIVSTHRIGEGISMVNSRELYLERVAKEAAHELGHTFDLRHCKDARCLMHYCRSISDVDHKDKHLCRYCQVLLGDYSRKMGGFVS